MKLIFGELEKKINNRTILNRQLFSFNYGKIYLIKGESGSGKTTFLNIITGIDNQFEGEVVFNKLDKNKDLFFVHQKMDFFGKTSIKNWMLIFKNQFNSNYDIDSLIDEFDLRDIEKYDFSVLSNGEKRRFLFILMLIRNPIVMVLDEPFADLDEKNRAIMVKYLNELKKEHLIILTSHCQVEGLAIDKEMCIGNLIDIEDNSEHIIVNSNRNEKLAYKQNSFYISLCLIFSFLCSILFPFIFETHGDFVKKQARVNNIKVAYAGNNEDENIDRIKEIIYEYNYEIMYKIQIDNPLSDNFTPIGMYTYPQVYCLDNSFSLGVNEAVISDLFAATYIYDAFVDNKKDYLSDKTDDYKSLLNTNITIYGKTYKVVEIVDTGAYHYHKTNNYVESYFNNDFVSYAIVNDNVYDSLLDKEMNYVYFNNIVDIDDFIDELDNKKINTLIFEDQLTLIDGSEFAIRKFIKIIVFILLGVFGIMLILSYVLYLNNIKSEFKRIKLLTTLFFFDYNTTINQIYKNNIIHILKYSVLGLLMYVGLFIVFQYSIQYINLQMWTISLMMVLTLLLFLIQAIIYRGAYDKNN